MFRNLMFIIVILSVSFTLCGFGQDTDKGGVIDLAEDIAKGKVLPQEFNMINYIAILIIVLLLCGIYILLKMLNNKKTADNKSIQILDKLYLDSKNIIYVMKIYDEIIKIAVSKNGVTYLGNLSDSNRKGNEFLQLVNGGGTDKDNKLGVSSTYMKVVEGIEEIDDKIKKWQEQLKVKGG